MERSSIVWVTVDEVVEYGPQDSLPAEFGAKARGLLWVPAAWVPPFFVVSSAVCMRYRELSSDDRARLLLQIAKLFARAKTLVGISASEGLILRSNAIAETLQERGSYFSWATSAATAEQKLGEFYSSLDTTHPGKNLAVIVQRAISGIARGHLSNERRVADEYRDALLEVEAANGDITERRISFRRWRSGKPASENPLVCTSENDIANALRPVLSFSTQRRKRAHFEWVWDGKFVHVVQADIAEDRFSGTSPEAPIRGRQYAPANSKHLTCFVPVDLSNASTPGKLRNHAVYSAHGYWQPTFYQLTDPEILKSIVEGKETTRLQQDLAALTERPLIIRTSSSAGQASLLPRSCQLTNPEQARKWLYEEFARQIRERNCDLSSISLLAHHYIPAKVAAFSMGSSERLEVYIESLWGIPEGLYYYPFDAHLVQTVGTTPSSISAKDYGRFVIRKRVCYKSHFVAPDDVGNFVRYEVSPPWDWKPTIDDKSDVLPRMAAFTRQLADIERQPVNIMWFLACATQVGSLDILPWYHERLESNGAAASDVQFQRNSRDEELEIAGESDLAALEARANSQASASNRAARLVVRLCPAEDRAIRSEDFARRVGEAAKRLGAIVVLSGATLSHIYYVLSRTGVHLSVQNRADLAVRKEIHEKLVRDKIPATVTSTGEVAEVAKLTSEEIVAALRLKLVEEAFEVRDAAKSDLGNELADALEVIRALAKASGIGLAAVERLRKKKEESRGGFEDGVVLLATGVNDQQRERLTLLADSTDDVDRIVTGTAPALESLKMGPVDVRDTPEFVEHVQSVTVALTHPEWTVESPVSAELPDGFSADNISWSIDGKRRGTNLYLRIKVRVGTKQLELPFEFPQGEDNLGDA